MLLIESDLLIIGRDLAGIVYSNLELKRKRGERRG
jgi:hypothetical protein